MFGIVPPLINYAVASVRVCSILQHYRLGNCKSGDNPARVRLVAVADGAVRADAPCAAIVAPRGKPPAGRRAVNGFNPAGVARV